MKNVVKVGVEMTLDELMRMDGIEPKYMTQWGAYVLRCKNDTYIAEIKGDKACVYKVGEWFENLK